jgi:hypothetical protein
MLMNPFFIGDKSNGAVLNIITGVSQNSRAEGGYYDGIKPDCPAKNDDHFDFGDPREPMMAEALHLLTSRRCSSAEKR